VWFIGARGSGESGTADPKEGNYGMGKEVNYMASVVSADLKAEGLAVAFMSDPYPSDPVDELKPDGAVLKLLKEAALPEAAVEYAHTSVDKYDASMAQGIKGAEDDVAAALAGCPDAKIIMAGYSQGAAAVHDAENWLDAYKPGEFSHIVGTLLLGDPDRVADTKAKSFGSAPKNAEGLRVYLCVLKYVCLVQPHEVPDPATTAEIANANDIVADFALLHLLHYHKDAKVHEGYETAPQGRKLLATAANWAASKVPAPTSAAWTAVEAPLPANADPAQPDAGLRAIACPLATECIAAGRYDAAS
jgi:hypothetical protein